MRNLPAFRHVTRIAALVIVLPAIAHAHPGHEGHELTWDINHLAEHPWATGGCFAAIAGVVWIAARILKIRAERPRRQ